MNVFGLIIPVIDKLINHPHLILVDVCLHHSTKDYIVIRRPNE